MSLYSRGLIIGGIFASEIWGAYFFLGGGWGGAYYRNFTVCCIKVHSFNPEVLFS